MKYEWYKKHLINEVYLVGEYSFEDNMATLSITDGINTKIIKSKLVKYDNESAILDYLEPIFKSYLNKIDNKDDKSLSLFVDKHLNL